jgi:tetratricopeptide (TPR) repeat protein
MSRVTSLTSMSDKQLNRWIKRIGLLLLVGVVAFIAFYAVDRFRASPPTIADQELTTLEELVRTNPADAVSRGQLADLYYGKSRFEDAIAQYTMLIDAKKQVELASLGRGRSYQKLEQFDKAVPDFNKVIEIGAAGEMAATDPILAAGYYGLGTTQMSQNKPKDAIETLRKALAIQHTDADVLFALGQAYIAGDQAKDAIEPLTLAIQLVPIDWPEPYLALETAYTKTGDAEHAEWAGAMGAFAGGDAATAEQRLLKLVDGKLALEAAVGLGVIKEAAGDAAAATEWYAKALAIDPENITAKLGIKRVEAPSTHPSIGTPASPAAPSASPAGS